MDPSLPNLDYQIFTTDGPNLVDLDTCVNDVIADKNVVTKIMNNSTGLQRIESKSFAKRHWQTGYYPFAYGWCLGLR